MTRETTEALETFRYAEAARVLYAFAWDEFCSFYLEILKERRGGGFPDLDLHAGVELGKIGHQRGQAVVQAEIDAAHPEGALAVAAVLFHGVEIPADHAIGLAPPGGPARPARRPGPPPSSRPC